MSDILGNLLNDALAVIPPQTGQITRFASRTKNARNQWVNTYDTAADITGSFQAIPRDKMEQMGLDFKKVHYVLYTSEDAAGFKRGEAGDVIVYAGMTFQLVVEGGWKPVDGWSGLVLVEIGDR
jgi:hypothetical protein